MTRLVLLDEPGGDVVDTGLQADLSAPLSAAADELAMLGLAQHPCFLFGGRQLPTAEGLGDALRRRVEARGQLMVVDMEPFFPVELPTGETGSVYGSDTFAEVLDAVGLPPTPVVVNAAVHQPDETLAQARVGAGTRLIALVPPSPPRLPPAAAPAFMPALSLSPHTLHVQVSQGLIYPFPVTEPESTIDDLKDAVLAQRAVRPVLLKLHGRAVPDETLLRELPSGAQLDATLVLDGEHITVVVVLAGRRHVQLEVGTGEPLRSLQDKIEVIEGIPHHLQRLSFEGRAVEDMDITVGELGMDHGSQLELES